MKRNNRFKTIAALSAFITTSSYGEFDVPRSIFRLSELDEAKAKAIEKDEPLVFVVTNPATK